MIADRNKTELTCIKLWHQAMGIDWMRRDELTQAIPPAYSEHIGRFALQAIRNTPTQQPQGEELVGRDPRDSEPLQQETCK